VKEVFEKILPEDINLELGISQEQREMTYHMFNEPALNTFSPEEASKKDSAHDNLFLLKKKKQFKPIHLKIFLPNMFLTNRLSIFLYRFRRIRS
jgi:hypothetical protein